MALSSSPRKIVPLSTGDEPRPRYEHPSSSTKRVFFCGVVVEGSENGRRLPEVIQELVLSLGDILSSEPSADSLLSQPPGPSTADPNSSNTRKRALTNSSAFQAVLDELVATERSYVERLRVLKHEYADPLRVFSRNKATAILPPRVARVLFGNIDNLVPVNEAFLHDLERMVGPNGSKLVGGIGDVALRHFKELKGFEQYKQFYSQREDAQHLFEQEISKRSSPFAAYIDRIKYQSSETKNRIGLRELLMDPIQRIPRYTLLFRTMIKHMAPGDPQRVKLIEADEIASKIALAEADEQTKRAAILYCLNASIEGFPPDLVSYSQRHFIDCIDVEDVLGDTPMSSAASINSASSTTLHSTLFLFDDKLLIAKRPSSDKGGRTLAGLEDLDKVIKAGSLPLGKKKGGMVCKGVLDITEVVATDVGGADIHLYLENPPQDQGERWSGRAFRALSVVLPPGSMNLDPTTTEGEKHRFLENLWIVQAKYRARSGQSVVLRSEDVEVETKSGRRTAARTYYNVYQRTAFLQEPKKTKVVVHIDALGSADKIPFGIGAPPFVIIRLQPLAGGVCRYKVTSSDPSDPGEEDIVQTARVPSRIILTIHQFGLFEFRTNRPPSRPSTPTARSKVSIFGLDAISRNLFNSRSTNMTDFFSGSVNSHRRAKSTASRSSTYTHTTTTADNSLLKFSRSNSTTSAATSVDDDSSVLRRSPSRKVKRGVSPRSASESESPVRGRQKAVSSPSPSRSRSQSRERSRQGTDDDEDDDASLSRLRHLNPSDRYLAMQLALARRNSKNQYDREVPGAVAPSGDVIFEEDLIPTRPVSPAASNAPSTITPCNPGSPTRPSRTLSKQSSERHPHGPRTPSPLPPSKALDVSASHSQTDVTSRIPRSKRQPFHPAGNTDRAGQSETPSTNTVEPLTIKKKTSDRPTSVQHISRKTVSSKPVSKTETEPPRRAVSSPTKETKEGDSSGLAAMEQVHRLFRTTKEDVESSHRAVKRLKLDVEGMCEQASDDISRPASPTKGLRTPQASTTGMSKAALDRMEEMRQALAQRQGEGTPRSRPRSVGPSSVDLSRLRPLLLDADRDLTHASSGYETLRDVLTDVDNAFKAQSKELRKTQLELQNAKRQTEVIKSLLTDATTEKDIMYDAFNEELDSMYNDVNLPDDEAWQTMCADLRRTKEARNNLSKENSQLKRKLAEVELQQEECMTLLRGHSLVP